MSWRFVPFCLLSLCLLPGFPARWSAAAPQRGRTAPPTDGTEKQRLLGLCVGIRQYKYPNARGGWLRKLPYADADAQAVAVAIRGQHGMYSSAEAVALTDGQAERKDINRELKRLEGEVRQGDTLILFMRGHGVEEGGHYYYCAYDTHPGSEDVDGSALKWANFLKHLETYAERGARVLVLLDSDYSRLASLRSRILASKGLVLLCAGDPTHAASITRAEWEHGAFAKALVEGLTNPQAAFGQDAASLTDLIGFTQRRVVELTDARQRPSLRFMLGVNSAVPFIGSALAAGAGPALAIEFVEPQAGSSPIARQITVKIVVRHARNPQDPHLFIEGRTSGAKPITVVAKDLEDGLNTVSCTWSNVTLPEGVDEAMLRATVYDVDGTRADAGMPVVIRNRPGEPIRPPGPRPPGDLYLLCVGVSSYRDSTLNLQWAARDAEEMAGAMRKQVGRHFRHVVEPTVLTNADATKANLKRALARLQRAGPEDTVFVFMSGHGTQEGGRFYFAPHEVDRREVVRTCLPWQEVTDALASVPAAQLLIADACHSGCHLGNLAGVNAGLAEAAQRAGIVMIGSCSGNEESWEDPKRRHGYFTAALLDALRGEADDNQDGVVTLWELEKYLGTKVGPVTNGKQHPHATQDLDLQMLQMPLARAVVGDSDRR